MAREMWGAPVAKAIMESLAPRVAKLAEKDVTPTLEIVRVGSREDDLSYERAAVRRCEGAGIAVRVLELPEDVSQAELEGALRAVSADCSVHGCLLFRPLPRGLDEAAAAAALDPAKDVDAITDAALLGTLAGRSGGFAPCTAEAVIALLDHYRVELDGANACVVGRSLVIGRPVAALLTARNATVTICHTHTRDLAACCRRADVVVACAGSARMIGAAHVRTGQAVADVGINWDEVARRLVGDVDADAVAPVVDKLAPVPGGVGSVTTAILARHVVEAAERSKA